MADAFDTVVLLHELPDGSSHLDWMLRAPDAASLMTYRMTNRVDQMAAGGVAGATRLPDHRLAYLEQEGRVSRGRGTVRRLARGRVLDRTLSCNAMGAFRVLIEWSGPGAARLQRLLVDACGPDECVVMCEGADDRQPSQESETSAAGARS
jgi:hypothetical protein